MAIGVIATTVANPVALDKIRQIILLYADLVNWGTSVIAHPVKNDPHTKVRQIMFLEILYLCHRKNI